MAHKVVYMIRHGQTPGNLEKKYIGRRSDESLSETGIRQAGMLRDRIAELTGKDPLRVCASPMKRTVETARILFGGAEPESFNGLEEMDFGIFEGKTHDELCDDESYRKWLDSGGLEAIEGGESFEAFCLRTLEGFVGMLGEKSVEETIAVVCHGGTIMAVLHSLTGKDHYGFICENLGGYRLDLEYDDEGIHDLSYRRLDAWGMP